MGNESNILAKLLAKQRGEQHALALKEPAPIRVEAEKPVKRVRSLAEVMDAQVPEPIPQVAAESLPSIAPDAQSVAAVYGDASQEQTITETDESLDDRSLEEVAHGDREAISTVDERFNILSGVNIELDESQRDAVHGLARDTMGCLMGKAGTGKTTTMKYLLHTLLNGVPDLGIDPVRIHTVNLASYLDENDHSEEAEEIRKGGKVPSIAFVAYTGVATQVMKKSLPEAWHANVMTVHTLLGYAPVWEEGLDGKRTMRFEPSYTATRKFGWDIIFVDEASMLGTRLWNEVRAAAHDDCRFYFIGDLNQLAPTMDSSMYGYAMYELPSYELTHIHRQADPAANVIIEAASQILEGKAPKLESASADPNWRFIGLELPANGVEAHKAIVAVARKLAGMRIAASVDPAQPAYYVPERDRIITPMNGDKPDSPASVIGQVPLNETLADVFLKPGEERWIISFQRGQLKVAVGSRVMCLRNESPGVRNRVTNGSTGIVTRIEPNPAWTGDRRMVGRISDVVAHRKLLAESLGDEEAQDRLAAERMSDLEDIFADYDHRKDSKKERLLGPASHIVEVQYDSGAKRVYENASEVEQLALAYASTTHKAQGSECPTVIIVVHHLHGRMLTRENLYTAVTRASQRVVLLYTKHGLRLALARQEILGDSLEEKLRHFRRELKRHLSNAKHTGRMPVLPKMRPDSYYAVHGNPYDDLM